MKNKQTPKDQGTASHVIAEIEAYEKQFEPWMKRGKEIVKRYRDERASSTNANVVTRKFNILWSNTETLRPTLYARLPSVQVERRFKDADPVGRVACQIAERAGNYLIQTGPFGAILENCVEDYLLPGRGVMWIHYDVDGEDVPQAGYEPKDEADEPPTEFKKIQETITPTYVDWRDFGHQPKRHWQENKLVWRRTYLTRAKLIKRFGKKLGNEIDLDRTPKEDGKADEVVAQATIYEVWDKERRKVCWVHRDQVDYLDEIDPPISLEGFWPCANPLNATMTNGTLIPVPDYTLYQDQAEELNKLTNRIGRLTDALKVVGVYNASVPELSRLLSPNGTPDNVMIPVTDWAALSEKGGLNQGVQFIPLTDIVNALIQAYQAREQVLNVIYQITGISDLLRGSSDPRETATAQGIKGQYGSTRIKARQGKVATFARDNARIIVEIAVEMFEPQLLWEMTNAKSFCAIDEQAQMALQQMGGEPQFTDSQEFMKALELLRNDKLRSFHVDIETDSTIALDEAEDKASTVEFITAVGQFLGTFGPIVAQQPAMAPLAGEMLLYASRRFKAGRSLESSIEKAIAQIAESANQPKPPSPEEIKLQNEKAIEEQRMMADQQKAMQEAESKKQMMDLDAQKAQEDAALKRFEVEENLKLAREKAATEANLARFKVESHAALEQRKAELKAQGDREAFKFKASMDASRNDNERASSNSRDGALGQGLAAIGEGLRAIGKPKSLRVEGSGSSRRYIQE